MKKEPATFDVSSSTKPEFYTFSIEIPPCADDAFWDSF